MPLKHAEPILDYCSYQNVFATVFGHFQRPNIKWKWLWSDMNDAID